MNRFFKWLKRTFTSPTPCLKAFHEAEHKRGTCSNKAGYYMRALAADGYEPVVHLVMLNNEDHAVVEVEGRYYDPTWGRSPRWIKRIWNEPLTMEDIGPKGAWHSDFKDLPESE